MSRIGKAIAGLAFPGPLIRDAREAAFVKSDGAGTCLRRLNHALMDDRKNDEEKYRDQNPVDRDDMSGENPKGGDAAP